MSASQYFPPVLLQWSRAPFADEDVPLTECFEGAVLLVDISGFTDLTERLSNKGRPGAEQINNVLTRFFSDIEKVIDRHGGMIFDYEGDSVIVGWRKTSSQRPDEPVLICCACAEEILREFSPRHVDGHRLDVRISVGTGRMDLIHLGFDDGRRYLLPAGQAIDEAALLSTEARPGEVLISAQVVLRIQGQFTCEPRDERAFRLVVRHDTSTGFSEAPARYPTNDPLDSDAAENYILPLARARLNSALADWMGEVRKLTLVFAEIRLNDGTDDLGAVNETVIEVERLLESLGGAVLSIRLRHRMLLVETAFGLPGEAQQDDDWRSVATMMELQAQAGSSNISVCAGIATGRVFCGPYGAPHFRKYTTIGSAANRAARLRDVAEGRILVDEETQKVCKRSVGFEGPWPVQLSGIRETVQSYVPTEEKPRQPTQTSSEIIGRIPERETLREMLAACERQVQVAVINGEAGIGKSTLVEFLLAELGKIDGLAAIGMADALDRQTPYLAWRGILRQFLGLPSRREEYASVLPDLLSRFEEAIGDTTLAPLINDVIDLNLPESRVTASMASNVRAENLRKMLLKLILHHLKNTTRLLVIEDAHWLDQISRELLLEIIRATPNALVVITSRLDNTLAPELAEFVAQGHNVRHLPLSRLDESNVIEVARRALGNDQLSASLQNFIVQTSDGVPLFVEELCHLALTLGQSGISELTELPNLLEATILGRIDTLSPEDQLVLKTASVFGLRFNRPLISKLNQLTERRIDIETALKRIAELRLFRFNPEHPDDFEFRHQIIRDLVYDGMLSDQRSETHAAVAQEMEAQASAEDVETLPLLLTHWRLADNAAKIVTYLERVAALRLRQFDNAAAISLLEEYFDRIATSDVQNDLMRDARCFMMLGKAHSGLGKMVEAEAAFRSGLGKLGMPLPDNRRTLTLGLGRQMLQQIRQRRLETPVQKADDDARVSFNLRQQQAEMAAEAHEMLMQIFYFNGQKGRLLHSALSAANLSAGLDVATPSLAINTAGLGAICGVIPLRKQAAHYLQRASEIAEAVDVPSVSSRVRLYSGLYETAVASFERAKRNFLDGMESADAIRDQRLWCEHAVSFELICSPWSLTPAFRDIDAWDELVDRLEAISIERSDFQVQACAVLGRLRGNLSIGRTERRGEVQARMEQLLSPASPKLELIHYAEGAGLLAKMAFETGDRVSGKSWLEMARGQMADLEPGMKSRTLPALVAVFEACLCQLDNGTEEERAAAVSLASSVIAKLRTFARIYPIGRSHLLLFRGDLAASAGNSKAATGHWRAGLSVAMRLGMYASVAVLMRRLEFIGADCRDRVADETAILRQLGEEHSADREMFHRILSMTTDIPVRLRKDGKSETINLGNN